MRVEGLEFRIWGLGFREVHDTWLARFVTYLHVQRTSLGVPRLRVDLCLCGFVFRVSGFGFRASRFRFWGSGSGALEAPVGALGFAVSGLGFEVGSSST